MEYRIPGKFFIKAKSADEYKLVLSMIDHFKENAKVFAYCKDRCTMVVGIYDAKALKQIKEIPEIFSMEEETIYYK